MGWSSEGDAALPIALVGVNCAHGLLPSLQNRRAELLFWLIGWRLPAAVWRCGMFDWCPCGGLRCPNGCATRCGPAP